MGMCVSACVSGMIIGAEIGNAFLFVGQGTPCSCHDIGYDMSKEMWPGNRCW